MSGLEVLTDIDKMEELVENEDGWHKWYHSLGNKGRGELEQLLKKAPRVGPQKGPQTQAFISEADVVGYGGAAGGGKSALIALLALLSHERTVIFRKDGKQMAALVDDIVQFYGSDIGLNRGHNQFYLGDRPRHMIEWGGIGNPGDENVWRGRAHDLLCVDEATEVAESKVRFLMSWNRSATPGQRVRALLTFNPPGSPGDEGGAGGRWVVDYFRPWLDEHYDGEPAEPGELRWFWRNENGEEVEVPNGDPRELKIGDTVKVLRPQSRTFIPALVGDNKYLAGTGYENTLASLPEPLRSKMLLGDFRQGILDQEHQVIPGEWVDAAMKRWSQAKAAGELKKYRAEPMTAMGVDVARGGKDKTVLARRHGWFWDNLISIKGTLSPDGPAVAGKCLQHVRDGATICIDSIGVGASPFDFLREQKVPVKGVNNQSRKGLRRIDKEMKPFNKRAQNYWRMRLVLDPANRLEPMLPYDRQLRAELVAPTYDRESGLIRLESKEKLKLRIGHSPDKADAVVNSLEHIGDEDGVRKVIGRAAVTPLPYNPYRSNYGSTWMGT